MAIASLAYIEILGKISSNLCIGEGNIRCINDKPVLISKRGALQSLHAEVYRVENAVLKIRSWDEVDLSIASECNRFFKDMRQKFDFLPEYYGTIITADEMQSRRIIVNMFEYVEPLNFKSVKDVEEVFEIILKVQSEKFFIDLKPSNFGKKNGKILYLDDYGIGKDLLPPDVMENIRKFRRRLLRLHKRILSSLGTDKNSLNLKT